MKNIFRRTPRRKHGKRSAIGQLQKVRRKLLTYEGKMIDRTAMMELAHAVLAIRQAVRFVRAAETLTARTL